MLGHGRMRVARLRPLKDQFIGIRLPTCGFSACGGWARCPATQWDFGLGIGFSSSNTKRSGLPLAPTPRHVNGVPSACLATGRYISQVTRKMQVMSRIGVSVPFTIAADRAACSVERATVSQREPPGKTFDPSASRSVGRAERLIDDVAQSLEPLPLDVNQGASIAESDLQHVARMGSPRADRPCCFACAPAANLPRSRHHVAILRGGCAGDGEPFGP